MFSGSIVALVTPMQDDGSVDFSALDHLVDWHISNKTDAIVAVGTTGESATLTVTEHTDVIRRVVVKADGRIPVIAGTGANSTAEAIELTEAGKAAGADACLLVTPYYNKPTQEGLYQHYKAIAEAVGIPQILYNVPGRTGCDMLPETVVRLAAIENIVGLKEATGDLARIDQLIGLLPQDFVVLSGDDATACESILRGCRGDISVTANVAPQAMHDMCVAALAGDREAAEAFDAPLQGLHDKLFVEPNPIPVKWALYQMGQMGKGIRLPLTTLEPGHEDDVTSALRQAGSLT